MKNCYLLLHQTLTDSPLINQPILFYLFSYLFLILFYTLLKLENKQKLRIFLFQITVSKHAARFTKLFFKLSTFELKHMNQRIRFETFCETENILSYFCTVYWF